MAGRDMASAFYPMRDRGRPGAAQRRGRRRAGDLDRPRGGCAGGPTLPPRLPHRRGPDGAGALRTTGDGQMTRIQLAAAVRAAACDTTLSTMAVLAGGAVAGTRRCRSWRRPITPSFRAVDLRDAGEPDRAGGRPDRAGWCARRTGSRSSMTPVSGDLYLRPSAPAASGGAAQRSRHAVRRHREGLHLPADADALGTGCGTDPDPQREGVAGRGGCGPGIGGRASCRGAGAAGARRGAARAAAGIRHPCGGRPSVRRIDAHRDLAGYRGVPPSALRGARLPRPRVRHRWMRAVARASPGPSSALSRAPDG